VPLGMLIQLLQVHGILFFLAVKGKKDAQHEFFICIMVLNHVAWTMTVYMVSEETTCFLVFSLSLKHN
jgi:hypothetical protein